MDPPDLGSFQIHLLGDGVSDQVGLDLQASLVQGRVSERLNAALGVYPRGYPPRRLPLYVTSRAFDAGENRGKVAKTRSRPKRLRGRRARKRAPCRAARDRHARALPRLLRRASRRRRAGPRARGGRRRRRRARSGSSAFDEKDDYDDLDLTARSCAMRPHGRHPRIRDRTLRPLPRGPGATGRRARAAYWPLQTRERDRAVRGPWGSTPCRSRRHLGGARDFAGRRARRRSGATGSKNRAAHGPRLRTSPPTARHQRSNRIRPGNEVVGSRRSAYAGTWFKDLQARRLRHAASRFEFEPRKRPHQGQFWVLGDADLHPSASTVGDSVRLLRRRSGARGRGGVARSEASRSRSRMAGSSTSRRPSKRD